VERSGVCNPECDAARLRLDFHVRSPYHRGVTEKIPERGRARRLPVWLRRLRGDHAVRFVPRKLFLTRGVGINKEKLTSFEMALRNAGIAHVNIVRVSSIFPPGCKIVSPEEGLAVIEAGEITFAVLAEMATNEPARRIAASVGIAIPADNKMYGYLSEHHSYGQTEKESGDYAEDLAASMLATLLSVPFDLDKDWNERREQYRMGGHIVESTSITQTAEGAAGGAWTTVVAAAVLL
jgi:arginine decarboxylase